MGYSTKYSTLHNTTELNETTFTTKPTWTNTTNYESTTQHSPSGGVDPLAIALGIGIPAVVILIVGIPLLVVYLRKRKTNPTNTKDLKSDRTNTKGLKSDRTNTKDLKSDRETREDKDRYMHSPRRPEVDNAYETTEVYSNVNQGTEEQHYENVNFHNKNSQKQPNARTSRGQTSEYDDDVYEMELPTAEGIYTTNIESPQMNCEDEIYENHSVVKQYNKRY